MALMILEEDERETVGKAERHEGDHLSEAVWGRETKLV